MSTLKTNNIQHVDRSEPSILINTDGSVSIAGTVSYEDSTNVDSVGVVTARKHLHVGTGVSIAAGGLNVTAGITTVQALQATTGTFTDNITLNSTDKKIYLSNDSDQYITANASSNYMVFATANAERVRIDSSGRIGVGVVPTAQYAHNLIQIGHQATLGANAALSATGQTFLTHNLYFDTGGTFRVFNTSNANEGAIFRLVDGQLLFSNSAATTGTPTVTERFRITSAGSVGINSTSPDRRFTLHQDATCRMNLKSLSNSTAGIEFGDEADHNAGYIVYDNTNNSFQFGVNGTGEKLRIDSAGRLLLGVTSDSRTTSMIIQGNSSGASQAQLHMDSGTASVSDGTNLGIIRFGALGDRRGADIRGLGDGTWSAGSSHPTRLAFYTNPSSSASTPAERFRIDKDGKLSTGGESAPDVSTGGLCLNQGANDTNILSFKSSDIAHGVTTLDETDTYFSIKKASGDKGGVRFQGFTDTSGADGGFEFYAIITDDSAQGYQGMEFKAGKVNGTGTTNIATNRRIAVFKNNDGSRIANVTGEGITFGDDRETANALDDYEEGTFAPMTSTLAEVYHARYTKIGNLVTINCCFQMKSGQSRDHISLPFQPNNDNAGANDGLTSSVNNRYAGTASFFDNGVNAVNLMVFHQGNQGSSAYFLSQSSNGTQTWTRQVNDDFGKIGVSMTYHTAS